MSVYRVPDQGPRVYRRRMEGELPAVGTREVQEIVDQALHPRRRPLHGGEGHALHPIPFGASLAVLAEEDAERQLDGAQRALEVVRHYRHQLVARPRRLLRCLVEERMIDRGARAAPDIGGEREVPRAVAASGLRGDGEEDRPERAAAGDHRHGDGRQGRRGADRSQAAVCRASRRRERSP